MINRKRQKEQSEPNACTPEGQKSLIRREWPLLLYPVVILIALAALHAAHQSLQQRLFRPESASSTSESAVDASPGADPVQEQQTDGTGGDSSATAQPSLPSLPETTVANQDRTLTSRPETADPNGHSSQLSGLAGNRGTNDDPVAQLLNDLRQALKTEDHAQIKQCMSDLVAMGDDAVTSLAEVIANNTDGSALWAAEAMAQIGTPSAAAALVDTLEQIEDGAYKEQLAKRVSNISNHDSWPLLLDTVQDSLDPTVQRAAATSLARMADTAIVDELVARYDAAATQEEADQMVQIISNISSSEASASLRSLAGDISAQPQDGLEMAAVEALAKIGDAQSVSYLLQKLEASSPGEGGYLFNAITTIDQPQAQSALLYAAAGNKEVSAEQGRTAAICALENYPSEETYRLLEQIVATEDNTAVATAALRTLEAINKKQPAVAENATSKADTTSLLPVNPLQK